jgi:hypothetical protein
VNEKLNCDSQPQSEPRGGGVAKHSLKKKSKAGNKKTAVHTAVKNHQKSWSQKLFLHP